ncbi:DNA-directed RNA polymerase subunit beta [Brevibacillus sp. H7]|jgi:hypothetical protein|uniref:DNA-directed RNA polymerase subunit beta n=1 Tax=Brevibacillus sp. H7 TaxID=3349138 RepID=UPI003809C1ED
MMDQVKGQRFVHDLQEAEREQSKRNRKWLALASKALLVPLLLFFSLVVGLLIGYSVMGKRPVSEVFDWNTYKHMYDLIFAGT